MKDPDEFDVAPFIREFSARRSHEGRETRADVSDAIDDIDVPSFVRKPTGGPPPPRDERSKSLYWDSVREGTSASPLESLGVDANVALNSPISMGPSTSVWSAKFPLEPVGLMLAGALSAKSEDGSEDSSPLVVLRSRGDGSVTLTGAVCDGVGGAGSSTVLLEEGSCRVERTQAFIASRLVRRVVAELALGGHSLEAQSLKPKLVKAFEDFKREYIREDPGALRGSMVKTLPSTLAYFQCLIDRSDRSGRLRLVTGWAGDSRIYVITPRSGLAQVTRDDVGPEDAFDQLKFDPPTTNVVNGSGPFDVHRLSVTVEAPCIVIAATDGLFGYLPTPGSLELLVLDELNLSVDIASFARSMCRRVEEIAADDVSFVVAMIGFGDRLVDVQRQFSARHRFLKDRYGGRTPEDLFEMDDDERESLWRTESATYNQLLSRHR